MYLIFVSDISTTSDSEKLIPPKDCLPESLDANPTTTEIEEKASLTKTKKILSGALSAFFFFTLIYFIANNFSEIKDPLLDVSFVGTVLIIILSIIPVLLRAECWNESCVAAGSKAPKSVFYSAAATSYVVQAFVSYLGVAVRISMVRKIAPELAPKIPTLLASEAPVIVLEAVTFLPIFCFVIIWTGAQLWIAALAIVLVVALLYFIRYISRRLTRHGWTDGLKALQRNHHLYKIVLLIVSIIVFSTIRTWLCLDLVGVEASIPQAILAMGIMAILGLANFGVAAAPSAMVVVFGSNGVATATAVGLLSAAAGILGALIVAIVTSVWAIHEHRKRKVSC